jgi:hypothetical protein
VELATEIVAEPQQVALTTLMAVVVVELELPDKTAALEVETAV